MKITDVTAKEIYDCRGLPTIECEIILDDGHFVTASVPSGTSVGPFEAHELRDKETRLLGMGVEKALSIIETDIAPLLIGREPNLVQIDQELMTMDVNQVGSNTILAVSMAVARAHAYNDELPLFELLAQLCNFDSVALPLPACNMLNGGMHANNNLAIQEIMVLPIKSPSFHIALETVADVHLRLKELLEAQGLSTAVGLEGGFAPQFKSETHALDLLMQAVEQTQAEYTCTMMICLDVAASHLFNPQANMYSLHGTLLEAKELIDWYAQLAKTYPIYSIEDGLAPSDHAGWAQMRKQLSGTVKIVGDDLCATNLELIEVAVEDELLHSVVIKPNQVGTVTQALQAALMCKKHGLDIVASHRSGETNDTFIADLAVAVSAQQIKAGGMSRGERVAKYNRLLTIEQLLMQQEEENQ